MTGADCQSADWQPRSAALRQGGPIMRRYTVRSAVSGPAGLLDPGLVERAGEFGLDQPLDDVRELLIEPALQHRAQQLSHEILEGARLVGRRATRRVLPAAPAR